MKIKSVLKTLPALAIGFGILTVLFPSPAYVADPPPRNVAFRRAAWHSSAANYGNTARLVTDGITGVLSREVIDTRGTSSSNPTYGQMIPGTVNSEWISASDGEEWVYVDLGDSTKIYVVYVYWGENYSVDYDVQISDETKTWETVAGASGKADTNVVTNLPSTGIESRYLRILCKNPPEATTTSAKCRSSAETAWIILSRSSPSRKRTVS